MQKLRDFHLSRAWQRLWRVLVKRLRFLDHTSLWHQAYYITPNPWQFDSQDETSRFEETSKVIEEVFGKLDLIIELGCGEGHQSHYLQKNARQLVGYDISQRAIRRARLRCPLARFYRANVESRILQNVPCVGNDLIVANELLYYLKDPGSLLRQMGASNAHILLSIYQNELTSLMPFLNEFEFSGSTDICVGSQVWRLYWQEK